MQVKLIPKVTYRVETESGELLGVFTKQSEWEGIMKLNSKRQTLLVDTPSWVDQLFRNIAAGDNERMATVLKASPDLLLMIHGEEKQ